MTILSERFVSRKKRARTGGHWVVTAGLGMNHNRLAVRAGLSLFLRGVSYLGWKQCQGPEVAQLLSPNTSDTGLHFSSKLPSYV